MTARTPQAPRPLTSPPPRVTMHCFRVSLCFEIPTAARFAMPQAVIAFFQVMPEHTGTETLQVLLRWAHFLAGITWIGLLYFFNLVDVPFMKTVTDPAQKQNVFKNMTLPALFWFRWGAVATVFVGFWYWAQTIVIVDARNGGS